METEITLRDGSRALVRPITAEDRDAVRSGFEAMSEESRYRRFFSPLPRLSAAQLTYLTDIDHHDHEALAAFTADEREPMGVARYVRTEPGADEAEVAVAVVDRFQGRGLATELLGRLTARAREEGISRFTATALAANDEVIDLLERLGTSQRTPGAGGVVEMEIELPVETHPASPLRRLLRGAAEGLLSVRERAGR